MKWRRFLAAILSWLLLSSGFLCFFAGKWYLHSFGGQSVNAILFTLFSGIKGVESNQIYSFVRYPLAVSLLLASGLLLLFCQSGQFHLKLILKKRGKCISLSPLNSKPMILVSLLICLVMTLCGAFSIELPQWLFDLAHVSTIYDEQYVAPQEVSITFPEKKRNLIYIYMESMETTFLSKEQGGCMESCVIPELYDLAMENTNFSATDQVGGWGYMTGGSWTTAGIVAQSGGIPLLLPFGENSGSEIKRIMPGTVLLWDILAEQGYYQTVMMGSDKAFSGQQSLMEQHHVDVIYDNNNAMEDGIIPQGFSEWWGMGDDKLYAYARQELTRISQMERPFNFTMITIDTHFPDGFRCSLCGDQFGEQYENVYACASAQLNAFLEWLRQQPFYENTTVVICGDHLTMDQDYISRNGLEKEPRWVYNCIVNEAAGLQTEHLKNRQFMPIDMFPTTLTALGCQIEGERLGLGANLYSGVPTLAEKLGVDGLNQELARSTLPYLFRFLLGKPVPSLLCGN